MDCDFICVESIETAKAEHLEPVHLQGETTEEGATTLSWQVTGSLPTSPFVVQHRADSSAAWSDLGTVDPADSIRIDTTEAAAYRFQTDALEVGTHQFRLAEASSDEAKGSGWTSKVVTTSIELEDAYQLETYPNPVRHQATIELAVKEQQDVAVQLYDLLGRQVATLHNGPLPAQEIKRLPLDVSQTGLPSGPYFVRAVGEDFAATQRLTVVQ